MGSVLFFMPNELVSTGRINKLGPQTRLHCHKVVLINLLC